MIAITDHDTLQGARVAQDLAARDDSLPRVVVGEEVTTQEGHVVGLWVEARIPPRLSALETVRRIHEQGGLAVAVHPFWRVGVHGVGPEALDDIEFDAVEVHNGAPIPGLWRANARAASAASRRADLAVTGGSDAHAAAAVGWGLTAFQGATALDLRRALEERRTRASWRSPNPWHLLRYLGTVGVHHTWLLDRPIKVVKRVE